MHISGVLIKWRQRGDVLNTHETFIQVRNELLETLDSMGVFSIQPPCDRKHVRGQAIKKLQYAVRHAGKIVGKTGFDTEEEARTWAEWNYKGTEGWEIIKTL